MEVMGTENQINKRIFFVDLLNYFRLLHHTSAESDQHMRIFLFHTVELSQMSIYLLIGIFTHRTGIVDYEICLILFFLFHISNLLQNSGQLLRIPLRSSGSQMLLHERSADVPGFSAWVLTRRRAFSINNTGA